MDKYYQLFVGKTSEDCFTPELTQAQNTYEGLCYRIPTMISAKKDGEERILAVCDLSESGLDHGHIQTVLRISEDGGESFSPMTTVLSLPVRKAPQSGKDFGSSLAIDPVLCQCKSGDIILVVDVFPESKAAMQRSWLEQGSGFIEVEGKEYPALYEEKFKAEGGALRDKSRAYTVREEGFIYTPEGEKTRYYLPKKHNPAYAYETVGDMYYAVGQGEFREKYPPLEPTVENCSDIYVGNIFLNCERPAFSLDKPSAVIKRRVGPDKKGEEYSRYDCLETSAAPLCLMPTMYLFMMKSSDLGRSWSQPVIISNQVKREDELFLGTGPGVAICLENQKDQGKNGRILVPVYNLKQTSVIYSDDEGESWKRSSPSLNIDETQLVEKGSGEIFCFGRQLMLDKTPLSISRDAGESWEKLGETGLSSVRCQKSFIMLPECSEDFPYADNMDKSKRYVVASCPSGNYQKKSVRYGGVVTLGEINGDEIRWLTQKRIVTEGIRGKYNNFYAYSCLALNKKGEILLMYEALPGSLIALRRLTLKELASGEKAFSFPLGILTRLRRHLRKW